MIETTEKYACEEVVIRHNPTGYFFSGGTWLTSFDECINRNGFYSSKSKACYDYFLFVKSIDDLIIARDCVLTQLDYADAQFGKGIPLIKREELARRIGNRLYAERNGVYFSSDPVGKLSRVSASESVDYCLMVRDDVYRLMSQKYTRPRIFQSRTFDIKEVGLCIKDFETEFKWFGDLPAPDLVFGPCLFYRDKAKMSLMKLGAPIEFSLWSMSELNSIVDDIITKVPSIDLNARMIANHNVIGDNADV